MKFNYHRGSATPKGKIPTTRLITKNYSIFPIIFDERGNKRPKEEIKRLIAGTNPDTSEVKNKE